MEGPAPIPFLETTRSLQSGNRGNSLLGVAGILLLVCGCGWAIWASLGVYEISQSARVEVPGTAAVEASVAGAVDESRIALGQVVRAGDPLVAIEVHAQSLELEEYEATRAGSERRLKILRDQLRSTQESIDHANSGWSLALRQTELEMQRTRSAADEALAELESHRRLHRDGIESAQELRRAEANWSQLQSLADQAELDRGRIKEEQQSARQDRESEISTLQAQIDELETERESSSARLRALRHQIDRRWLRAPVDGTVGELAELERGRYLPLGARVCTIVPKGAPRVVAWFKADSLGRVRTGQSGRLRLDGFPSTRYGSIDVEVRQVGGELREGRLRVELALTNPDALPVDLGHGYPGRVEVQTERLSPMALLLRFAGRRIEATAES